MVFLYFSVVTSSSYPLVLLASFYSFSLGVMITAATTRATHTRTHTVERETRQMHKHKYQLQTLKAKGREIREHTRDVRENSTAIIDLKESGNLMQNKKPDSA